MLKGLLHLTIVLSTSSILRAADYQIECRIAHGDPTDQKSKTVSAPTMIVKSDQLASAFVGGRVRIGAQLVPVGREVEVKATKAVGGGIRVHTTLKLHKVVGAPGSEQVTTTSEETTATIQPGGTVRVEIGKDPKNRDWVDVKVREAK